MKYGYSCMNIPYVGIRVTINGEKQKNEKEEHKDLTWFD